MIVWVLAFAALAGGIAVVVPWVPRNLNHAAFAEQLKKLLLARNPERARKLCGAAPRSPVAVSVGICLDRYLADPQLAGAELIAQMRQLYIGSMNAQLRRANRVLYLAALVIADAAVTMYLYPQYGQSWATFAPVIIGLLLVLAAFQIARKVAIQGAALGEMLYGVMAESR